MAKQLGADFVIKTTNMSEEQVANKIKELLGEDPTVSFDCAGAEQAVRIALTVSTYTAYLRTWRRYLDGIQTGARKYRFKHNNSSLSVSNKCSK